MIYRFFPALLLLAGCSQAPAPTEQLRVTDQAIAQTQAVLAGEAAPALSDAQTKVAQARAAQASGDNRSARELAEQAELDARVAEAQVLAARQQAKVAQLQARLERLRQQQGGGQ